MKIESPQVVDFQSFLFLGECMNELKQAFKISLPICFGYIFFRNCICTLDVTRRISSFGLLFFKYICVCRIHAICSGLIYERRDEFLDDCFNDFILLMLECCFMALALLKNLKSWAGKHFI